MGDELEGVCKSHSGIETSIRDIKNGFDRQSNFMRWVIGVVVGAFFTVSLAVVAFLWKGQSSLAESLSANQDKVTSQFLLLSNKVVSLETKIDIHMTQGHFPKTDTKAKANATHE